MVALAGHHAVVTGGGTGIGAAIARGLADAGAAVSLIGRREQPLADLAGKLPRAAYATADVTDPQQIEAALAVVRGKLGPVTILVNNAGAAEAAAFQKTSFEAWRRMMAINVDALYLVTQATLPDLREASSGRIIVIASTAGLKAYSYTSAYVTAKHAAIGFTRALAAELARTTITVNAVCPGFTDTELVARSVEAIVDSTGRSADEARAHLAAFNPQRRLIDPEEIAAATLWLCSPAARSVTGQAVVVAGGEVM